MSRKSKQPLHSKSSVSTQPRKAGIETGVISGPSPPPSPAPGCSASRWVSLHSADLPGGRREEQAPSGVTCFRTVLSYPTLTVSGCLLPPAFLNLWRFLFPCSQPPPPPPSTHLLCGRLWAQCFQGSILTMPYEVGLCLSLISLMGNDAQRGQVTCSRSQSWSEVELGFYSKWSGFRTFCSLGSLAFSMQFLGRLEIGDRQTNRSLLFMSYLLTKHVCSTI